MEALRDNVLIKMVGIIVIGFILILMLCQLGNQTNQSIDKATEIVDKLQEELNESQKQFEKRLTTYFKSATNVEFFTEPNHLIVKNEKGYYSVLTDNENNILTSKPVTLAMYSKLKKEELEKQRDSDTVYIPPVPTPIITPLIMP